MKHRGIKPTAPQKIGVRTLFDNTSRIHNIDHIGPRDGRQFMCDNDAGLGAVLCKKCIVD
jgi:hypothetical protein